MPIEFPCPTCRQQVRTPDAAAGKKGKCPNCGTLVMIPSPAVAILPSQPPPKPAPPPAAAPAPKPPPAPAPVAAGGPIEFPCPNCSQVVRTPASAAGKKGKCPHCQSVVQIPGGTPAGSPMAKPAPAVPSLQPLAQPQFQPARPVPPQVAPRPADNLPTLTPLAPASTPHAVPGLTPLGPAPANPYGGFSALPPAPAYPTPGLTPLPPAPSYSTPALMPQSESLPTLAPIASDPLAGLPAISPLGISPANVGAPLNPYSSPAATSYSQPVYQTRQIHDGNRRGLPWEEEPSMDSFGDTVNLVLGSPQEAFRMMRRSGGVGNPMGFFIVGGVIGQIASAIYATILQAIIFAVNEGGAFPWEALILYGAFQLIGGIIGIVLSGVIGLFISAAIYHVCLMILGGANAGYEATYRVIGYGAGSIAVLNAIPIVGPLIGLFMSFVVLIHGFTHAHEINGGKAAAATFLPFFFFCCICCGFGGLTGFGGLLDALRNLP